MIYPETLSELLARFDVSIPIIQRDYVQGSNETIIDELLDDIKDSIENNKQLRLNFVYGKTEGTSFIPLDGQQRLTTLFLLHLYGYRNSPEKDGILKKFSYETRRSSREFFQRLCDYTKRTDVLNSNSPSETIKDAIWFHTRWELDPTIKSALCCLDKIAEKFGNLSNLAEILETSDNKPIVFNFIPMTDMGMEDSLYIKLNARGRALTDFEAYKAELLAKVENEKSLPFSVHDFAIRLDTNWSDYFWELGHNSFDKNYRNFFLLIFSRISTTYKLKEDVSVSTLCETFYTLDYIVQNTTNSVAEYLKECITKPISYSQLLVFNSLALFFGKSKNEVDDTQLFDWFRVMKNLTINTTIERMDIYVAARSAIEELSKQYSNILAHLSSVATLNLSGFSPEQIKEERVKAKLIQRGYRDVIINAEQHKYFSGQIRSALNIAELTLEKVDSYTDVELNIHMDKFSDVWAKISALFGDNAPYHGMALRAALLTFDDYMPSSGQYFSFCVDRAEEPTSLKALFTSGHRSTIKLIDAFSNISANTIERELDAIRNNFIATGSDTDWKYWILKYYSEMMGYLSKTYMRICKTKYSYLLVSKYASSSHCKEIFTFALHLELQKSKKVTYLPDEYGRDADYRVVSGKNTIRYISRTFEITDELGNIRQAPDIKTVVSLL